MRVFIITMIICLTVLCSGCRYTAYIDYYSDIEDYEEIWDLSGFRHGYEDEMFFPTNLDNYDIIDYYCRYDQQFPLGEGIQVYLEIQFPDDDSIKREIDRISVFATKSDKFFGKSGCEAYATRVGEDVLGTYEYALVDHHNKKIYFIYLQSLPKDEIEFSHTLLPNGYTEYGKTGDGLREP